MVVDGQWEMVDANDAVAMFTEGAAPELLEPPVNVLRLSLHPRGMAPRIVNLGQWRAHLLDRLDRQITATGDLRLAELRRELSGYSGGFSDGDAQRTPAEDTIIVPLRYSTPGLELSFLSSTTVFGTPRDITVSELAIESFYPADAETAAALRLSIR
jgi:hypothetical protein